MNNTLLNGKDETENIVAIEVDKTSATVIFRNGKKFVERGFQPFILSQTKDIANRVSGGVCEELKGEGYKYLLSTDNRTFWGLVKQLKETNQDYMTVMDLQEQFMIQSGKTLFKGMSFQDLTRFQWNIEASGLSLTNNEILIICWKCGEAHGEIHGKEVDIIEKFVEVIKEYDPDVIESYNGFSYDWVLLYNRANKYGVSLDIGRNGSNLFFYHTFIRIGDNQVVGIDMPKIWGRHNIDLYYSARAWDVVYRELESYSLDEVSTRFGLKLNDMNIDKENMKKNMVDDLDKVIRHCSDDCLAVENLSNMLLQKDFYQTQMLPLSLEKTCVASASAKMTGIFLREYLRTNTAIPRKIEKREFIGALVGANDRGIYENVYKLDVQSLYPNIMLNYDICPKSDTLKIFPKVLKSLTDLRMDLKRKAKETGLERYKAAEQAHKILINAMYGLLGAPFFNWADMDEAEKVTTKGREILTQMETWLETNGFQVLEKDTDGIYLTNGQKIDGLQLLDNLNQVLPKGIDCDIEYYKFFCNALPKNYIRVTEDGTMKMTGVSFRSRAIEKFGKQFIKECMWDILYKRYSKIRRRYLKLLKRIEKREMNIDEISQHREINRSLDEYEMKKKKTDQVYECLIEKNMEVPIGNKISFYIAQENQ